MAFVEWLEAPYIECPFEMHVLSDATFIEAEFLANFKIML
jgi:hypothetical protein